MLSRAKLRRGRLRSLSEGLPAAAICASSVVAIALGSKIHLSSIHGQDLSNIGLCSSREGRSDPVLGFTSEVYGGLYPGLAGSKHQTC